jgi:hypothetical protein
MKLKHLLFCGNMPFEAKFVYRGKFVRQQKKVVLREFQAFLLESIDQFLPMP